MSRLFGTDGVRGVANQDLTVDVVTALGRAAATVLGEGQSRPKFVLGCDTRMSNDLLTAALTAGLTSAGADVIHLGVIPTAAIAWTATVAGAAAGAVISASHNPAPDNGVKFFGGDGFKLPDEMEDRIEEVYKTATWTRPVGGAVGRATWDDRTLHNSYSDHLGASCPVPLDGLLVALDCANGSASWIAPAAFRAAGARIALLFAEPDGININDGCGTTSPSVLQDEVVARGADIGVAFDGDADRCIAVDATGEIIDGDQILALCAIDRHRRGELRGDAVVSTVMSNLGLRRALQREGIDLHTTAVGDRYVLEKLRSEGLDLGGEQSGHTLFLDLATTGDGILTALQLCAVMARIGSSLAELASVMDRFPQILVTLPVPDKVAAARAPAVQQVIASAERLLGADGRVLVRASGTENAVRVMVEAADESLARTLIEQISSVVQSV